MLILDIKEHSFHRNDDDHLPTGTVTISPAFATEIRRYFKSAVAITTTIKRYHYVLPPQILHAHSRQFRDKNS